MPSYELVASRDFDGGDERPTVGMTFPGVSGTWRVIRIEHATGSVCTGEPSDEHVRLICSID